MYCLNQTSDAFLSRHGQNSAAVFSAISDMQGENVEDINAILSEIHYQAEVLKSSLLVSLIQVTATVFGLGLLIYSAVHSNPALQGLLQQYAGSISSAFWSVAIFLWVLKIIIKHSEE